MKFVAALIVTPCLFFAAAALADVSAGKSTYASRGCIGCHGADAASVAAAYPSLRGKGANYIRKSLTDYRSGARKNQVMNAMAASLSDAEIRNLADYIGSLD